MSKGKILDELSLHWFQALNSINLGQYRIEYTCICGAKYIADAHNGPSAPAAYDLHLADVLYKTLFEENNDH